MTLQTYNLRCYYCKKQTPHIIISLSRTLGARIKCVDCNEMRKRWVNLKILERRKKENV